MPRLVDHLSRTPLSEQLAAIIRQEIESGELRSGDRLPGELELMEVHSVSRNTVRRAFAMLDDVVLALPRRGRVVR